MEKEFDKRFSNGGKGEQWGGYWEDVDMFISTVKIEDVRAFIHSYTRKLIESVAEEIVGEEKEDEFYSPGEIEVYNGIVRNILRAEQRLKVKEIISSIGK